MFAETSIDGKTPEQYIADAEKNYHLEIKATKDQTLDQFVARQEHNWKMYDRSPGVPRYAVGGNDQTFHNSNGAMVASIREAGRGDVADQIQRDVEPPAEMHKIEHDYHIDPAGAGDVLAVDRRFEGLPFAPGASHELTPAQIRGRATPEPTRRLYNLPGREGGGVREAIPVLAKQGLEEVSQDLNRTAQTAVSAVAAVAKGVQHEAQAAVATVQAGISALTGRLRESGRPRDMLDGTPGGSTDQITVMRTQKDGTQSLERKQEPFRQSGPILSADADRVTQEIRAGETFTYSTKELLRSAHDPDAALRDLEHAASKHQHVTLQVGAAGLQMTAPFTTLHRGYDARGH